MKTRRDAIKLIRTLHPDSVGTRKNGNVVCRWGFFYTNGRTPQQYIDAVRSTLDGNGVPAIIVSAGENWAAFRGSASVAAQSHFFVEFKVSEYIEDVK